MAKVGRNDPCPCGSGRKHKQCCLAAADGPTDLLWQQLRRLIDPLPSDLLRFANRSFGTWLVDEAWREFDLDDEVPASLPRETPHMSVFMPWFLYDWEPDPVDTAVPADALDSFPIAAAYLSRSARVPPLLARYLEACLERPFSFYEVVDCTPGTGFHLRNLLTGEGHDVTERSASQGSEAGDIVFAKLVSVDHLTMMDGCGPVRIPPRQRAPIIELRRWLRRGHRRITDDVLRDADYELRDVYLDITNALLHPRMPRMQNTDGEDLAFHRISWEISSPRAAFDSLAALAQGEGAVDLPDDATVDPSGALVSVEFPWLREGNARHRSWSNTVLGTFRADGNVLTAEVNSEERARLVRRLVEEAMPQAVHRGTVVEPLEAALAAHRATPAGERAERDRGEEFRRRPEAQALLADYLRQHYRDWVDSELPALGGKTPRQAMRTADGREMVEALVVELERRGAGEMMPVDPSIVAELRATLQGATPVRSPRR